MINFEGLNGEEKERDEIYKASMTRRDQHREATQKHKLYWLSNRDTDFIPAAR